MPCVETRGPPTLVNPTSASPKHASKPTWRSCSRTTSRCGRSARRVRWLSLPLHANTFCVLYPVHIKALWSCSVHFKTLWGLLGRFCARIVRWLSVPLRNKTLWGWLCFAPVCAGLYEILFGPHTALMRRSTDPLPEPVEIGGGRPGQLHAGAEEAHAHPVQQPGLYTSTRTFATFCVCDDDVHLSWFWRPTCFREAKLLPYYIKEEVV